MYISLNYFFQKLVWATVETRNRNEKELTHSNCSVNGSHHCYYLVPVRSEGQSDYGLPRSSDS